jgi:hypothetical protein
VEVEVEVEVEVDSRRLTKASLPGQAIASRADPVQSR